MPLFTRNAFPETRKCHCLHAMPSPEVGDTIVCVQDHFRNFRQAVACTQYLHPFILTEFTAMPIAYRPQQLTGFRRSVLPRFCRISLSDKRSVGFSFHIEFETFYPVNVGIVVVSCVINGLVHKRVANIASWRSNVIACALGESWLLFSTQFSPPIRLT